MKDYANRNFGYSDVQQQVKVPIHWGFIIAALIAMLVIYSVWHHRQAFPVLSPVKAVSSPVPQAQQAVANVAPAVASPKTSAVTPTSAKATTPPPVKFDFYQMLTQNPSGGAKAASSDSSSTDQETSVKTSHPQDSAQTDTQPNVQANAQYYIQIGSYRSKAEALQQKANLILSEVSPKLIKVVNGNGHYRVLIGPYNKQAAAAAERSDLKQNGISGSLIKDNDLKK